MSEHFKFCKMALFDLKPSRVILVVLNTFIFIKLGTSLSAEKTVCDACQMNQYDTPFYCAIKPDLPQCIFPICPKVCEMVDKDGVKPPGIFIPYASTRASLYPHPPYLPRAGEEYFPSISTLLRESGGFQMGRALEMEGNENGTMEEELAAPAEPAVEDFAIFSEETCEFNSPYLRRTRPGSKYIEYRPPNKKNSYMDIHENAGKYGLVLAEIRRPEDEHSIAMSSILNAVSSYDEKQPRIYYAYAFRDAMLGSNSEPEGDGTAVDHGRFLNPFDETPITFGVFDPRQFGKTTEQCGVLTHVTGSDKRQYLITKMVACSEKVGATTNENLYGLLMYPPDSLCFKRTNEECSVRGQLDSGGDFHNIIQIGQTLKRFIYLYSDQRTWYDAKAFCEAKGLYLLDLDPRWDDAHRSYQVIEHFLRETKLNPVTTFWTSGRFDHRFSDGRFRWESTKSYLMTHYNKGKAPPYSFSWWDDQKEILAALKNESHIPRRKNIEKPCVLLALNPADRTERPKINFKAWYCDFPSFFLCYKEINQTDNIDNGPTPNVTSGSRPEPSYDACETYPPKIISPPPSPPGGGETTPSSGEPPAEQTTQKATTQKTTEKVTTQKTTEKATTQKTTEKATTQKTTEKATTQKTTEKTTQQTTEKTTTPSDAGEPPSGPSSEDPWDIEKCTSTSTTSTRLSVNSKYVDYQPKATSLKIHEIHEKCKQMNLVPAQITSAADWMSIIGSGIGGALGGDSDESDYFYVIGIDDKDELGKLVYTDSGDPVKFTMFYSEGNTDNDHRCVVLDTVPLPSDPSASQLMMHHANCDEGAGMDKVAFGLCMFPEDSKCFKQSNEEKSDDADNMKDATIIPIAQTSANRALYFTPVQRTWSGAKKYCADAGLSLLDFDQNTVDIRDVVTIFHEKIAHASEIDKLKIIILSGINKLAPIWTSGKLETLYGDNAVSGKWESTQRPIEFKTSSTNKRWIRRTWSNLTSMREGVVQEGCVEAYFDDSSKTAVLKPDFCDTPKFFLCYKKSRKRNDPDPVNGIGIYIIETGEMEEDEEMVVLSGPQSVQEENIPIGRHSIPNQFLEGENEGRRSDEEEEEDEEEVNDIEHKHHQDEHGHEEAGKPQHHFPPGHEEIGNMFDEEDDEEGGNGNNEMPDGNSASMGSILNRDKNPMHEGKSSKILLNIKEKEEKAAANKKILLNVKGDEDKGQGDKILINVKDKKRRKRKD